MEDSRIVLSVPRAHVKSVKNALEKRNLLDRTRKIATEDSRLPEGSSTTALPSRMIIYTTISALETEEFGKHNSNDEKVKSPTETLLAWHDLQDFKLEIEVSSYIVKPNNSTVLRNPLAKGLEAGLHALPVDLLVSLELTSEMLISSFPESYTIYKPMLLLPPNSFNSPSWKKLFASYPIDSTALQPLWMNISEALHVTYIAVNAGIPLQTHGSRPPSGDQHEGTKSNDNVLRSPINLTPIYGHFGPSPTARTLSDPTSSDILSTLWVSHAQNGIHQIWAPLYTMFSRGNIREKTRLLTLPSIKNSVNTAEGCTAVDLYAGIGYFAFSYKRAGVAKVLCWELNPWSIEGLKQGAEKNGWTTQVLTDVPTTREAWIDWTKNNNEADFLVFQQSNEYALNAVMGLNGTDPECSRSLHPIRHVNCGFLPSSILSWATAVKVLDHELGGWIHAHENVGVDDIEAYREKVVTEMQGHVDRWEAERGWCGSYRRRVRCEHIEKVKTYAPGVLHVVFDVWVDGMKGAGDTLS